MEMSIAVLSVGMSQYNAQRDVGTSVLKLEMDGMAQGVTDLLPAASQAMGIGVNIDLSA